MEFFQERRRWERLFRSRPVLFILGSLFLLLVIKTLFLYIELRGIRMSIKKAESEMTALEGRKAEFEEKIAGAQKGEGIEKEARSRFNVKKPGEETIIIVDDSSSPEDSKKALEKNGFFEWLKSIFGF